MRTFALVLLLALPALADVGPRPPRCSVPSSCVTCSTGSDNPPDCANDAADAGLEPAECTDRLGSTLLVYYCPPGTAVARGCSAAPADALVLAALGVLIPALRRRSAR